MVKSVNSTFPDVSSDEHSAQIIDLQNGTLRILTAEQQAQDGFLLRNIL